MNIIGDLNLRERRIGSVLSKMKILNNGIFLYRLVTRLKIVEQQLQQMTQKVDHH